MGKGLYEVRSYISDKRIARVIFTNLGNDMVLLHSFIKKEPKDIKDRFRSCAQAIGRGGK